MILMIWMVTLWTLLLAVVCISIARGWAKWPGRLLATALALTAMIPWLPSSHAEPPRKLATQIIYQFDDHRFLEMVGDGCEGGISYVDEKRKVRTTYIDQFARVFLPDITHADSDGDFIFLPYSDATAFAVSKDYGQSFQDARWVGDGVAANNIAKITVVRQQAFIETKDGRLFMTSKPFGKGWGMLVVDPVNHLPNSRLKERPEFQDLPKEVPEVVDYKGWTQMRCDPDLEGPPKKTLGTWWNEFQQEVLAFLGNTIAWPAAWLARALA